MSTAVTFCFQDDVKMGRQYEYSLGEEMKTKQGTRQGLGSMTCCFFFLAISMNLKIH